MKITNEERIKALKEMGYDHAMEGGDHVVIHVKGGASYRHTSLLCIMVRIGMFSRMGLRRQTWRG